MKYEDKTQETEAEGPMSGPASPKGAYPIVIAESVASKNQERKRVVHYMQGTKSLLHKKLPYLKQVCIRLKADVITIAYRGFSESDGGTPNEAGIMLDIDAITECFEKIVSSMKSSNQVETILWGKSFGCATSIVSHLKARYLHEKLILESPFTSVKDVFRSYVPCCCFNRIIASLVHIKWANKERI